jgi:hypothetical protein
MNNEIIILLQNIQATYQSIIAYFYDRILQTAYTNNTLATYPVNYTLLLPSSKYIINLNPAQCNAQVQAYIALCDELIVFIDTTVGTQTNLFYEQIQNVLNSSIAQLNGFTNSLLQAQYNQLFSYLIPYNMSLTTAMYENTLSFSTYALQASLNYNLQDFANLRQGSTITLSRT